jgi:regulator of cell morphogenesis and NO signaling
MRTRPGLTDRTIVELAATLPGATGVFRQFRFDFCCMLEQKLQAVAASHDTEVEAVEAALEALPPPTDATRPHSLEPLIGHILARYHMVHRRELPELIRLAEDVEERHKGHPDVPFGLAGVLRELAQVLDDHMGREENELFPRLRRVEPGSGSALMQLRLDHSRLEAYLCCLETLTAGHQPPVDASETWRRLYAGTAKLVEDLIRHRYLEIDSLDQCWRQGDRSAPPPQPASPSLH